MEENGKWKMENGGEARIIFDSKVYLFIFQNGREELYISSRKCDLICKAIYYCKTEVLFIKSIISHQGNGVCKTKPCNNGQCVPNLDGSGNFKCECDSGWVGER